MKFENAIRKLEKFGQVRQLENLYFTQIGEHYISFHKQREKVVCIYVQHMDAKTDIYTDHFPMSFCRNISQAIALAKKLNDK